MEKNVLSNGRLPFKQPSDDIATDTQDIISLSLPRRAGLHEKNPDITKLSVAGDEWTEGCK